MVDGDVVDNDGDEDADEIHLAGVESRTNLTPETKNVVVVALRITNRSALLGGQDFGVYKEVRERRRRGDALVAHSPGWRGDARKARHTCFDEKLVYYFFSDFIS
jgi:hypothetical protein